MTKLPVSPDRSAGALGWFSLALGAAELLAPALLANRLGLRGRSTLLQLYGLREIGAGLGLLSGRHRSAWLWARVAGDVLDLATLAAARPGRGRAVGLAAVAGVTVLDVVSASAAGPQSRERNKPEPRDYSDRIGLAQPPEQMRGLARTESSAALAWERRNIA
ncbi:hypothetical protein [Hydrocarboniphaga effusa]|nr:hypothetical protein [Hydrocarboniphaga effusa]